MPVRLLQYAPAMCTQSLLFETSRELVVEASRDALEQAGAHRRPSAVWLNQEAGAHIVMA